MKMKKFQYCSVLSIIVLICVICRESSAQNSHLNRKNPNRNSLQRNVGFNHRISQDTYDGLSQQSIRQQKKEAAGARRRTKSRQRQDHHGALPQ